VPVDPTERVADHNRQRAGVRPARLDPQVRLARSKLCIVPHDVSRFVASVVHTVAAEHGGSCHGSRITHVADARSRSPDLNAVAERAAAAHAT
jgi:hypothetical protein